MDDHPVFEQHSLVAPPWLGSVLSACREAIMPRSQVASLGETWMTPNQPGNMFGCWYVVVFVSPLEVYGGSRDGKNVRIGFDLNMIKLMQSFDTLETACWRRPVRYNDAFDGPELFIRGLVKDQMVVVRVLGSPPTDALAVIQVNPVTGELRPKQISSGSCG